MAKETRTNIDLNDYFGDEIEEDINCDKQVLQRIKTKKTKDYKSKAEKRKRQAGFH